MGMDTETRQKIFNDALFHTTKGTGGVTGTGLGLSLCKDLTIKQNGQIFVESTLSEGACFYIILSAV